MILAKKVRLYPTEVQEQKLWQSVGTARFIDVYRFLATEEFVEEYDKLLAVTGKKKLADVTKLMNIDIESEDFWKSSLKTIEEDIEEFIKLSKEI